MRGWKIKLIFLLIVYFAGFATAIYYFVPVSDEQTSELCGTDSVFSDVKSDEFARSFNSGLHKCVDFGKDAVCRVYKVIKQKLEERQVQNEG